MRNGVLMIIGAIVAGTAFLEGAWSVKTIHKHRLIGPKPAPSAHELSTRLISAKDSKCSLISCIGVSSCNQRAALHDAFELDAQQSATLSGALKPRCDLWEVKHPHECKLLLDVDIPATSDKLDCRIDRKKVLKLCQASSAVVIHLNPQDIRRSKNSFHLTRASKELIVDLASSKGNKTSQPIYLILPDVSALVSVPGGDDIAAYEQFKGHLLELVGKRPNVFIKSEAEQSDVYKSIKALEAAATPNDIAKAISTNHNTTSETVNTSLAHILDASFAEHNRTLRDRLCEIYKGELQPNFGSIVQASMLDAALSYYLRTFHVRHDGTVVPYLEQEYKRTTLVTSDAYLRLVILAEAAAKSKLRRELAKDPKQDTDALLRDVMTDYDAEVTKTLTALLTKTAPPEWLTDTIENMREQLREKLDAIVTVHKGLPKPTIYAKQEQAIEQNHEKAKKQRGVNMMLLISAMLRERGYGNRQGYINYQYGPLILTLGYANDRDVAENKPGTGILTPAFRIQPQLHVNFTL